MDYRLGLIGRVCRIFTTFSLRQIIHKNVMEHVRARQGCPNVSLV
jgi:hypothetical protein